MAENAAGKQPGRGSGRRFQKGQSGNPAGKPRGRRHGASILAETLSQDDIGAVLKAMHSAATTGDTTAARLLLDRYMPVRKGAPVPFDLPRISSAAEVDAALAEIARLMAAGELSPDEASTVASVIEMRRKAIETGEFAGRLAAIEQTLIQMKGLNHAK